jgi:hypothetical protein
MKSRKISAIPLFAAILLATCDGSLEPETAAEVGVISFHNDPVVIASPDTAVAGESFYVSIRTYGGGCTSEGGTTVQLHRLSADITPYDLVLLGHRVCVDILYMYEHRGSVVLHEPGVAQLSFHGRQEPGDSLITVVREIVVK